MPTWHVAQVGAAAVGLEDCALTGSSVKNAQATHNSAARAALPISRPAVSRHLRLLKDAGMVAEQARGTRRIYHLQEEGMRAVQAYLERVWGEAAVRFRLLAENSDPGAPR